MITIATVGGILFGIWFGLEKKKENLGGEIEELVRLSETRMTEKRERLRQQRNHEVREMIPVENAMDSPFVRKLADELYQEFGFNNVGMHEVLLRLRDLKTHQVEMLYQHLMNRVTFTDSPYQHLMLRASYLILTEIDPLCFIQGIESRKANKSHMGELVASAFHSLLTKDPAAALNYFSGISEEDLRSNQSPYSRMYTRMLAYHINRDSEAAMELFLMQKSSRRNLPIDGTWVVLPSMGMVREYAAHLKDLPLDQSSGAFVGLIASEAYRLNGVAGVAEFSKFMVKSGADKQTQQKALRSAFSSVRRQMASREGVEELSDFLASEAPDIRADVLVSLAYAWGSVDLLGASEWVKSESPGPDRDRMLRALISELREVDPAAAREWYPLISDDELRERYLEGARRTEALYRE